MYEQTSTTIYFAFSFGHHFHCSTAATHRHYRTLAIHDQVMQMSGKPVTQQTKSTAPSTNALQPTTAVLPSVAVSQQPPLTSQAPSTASITQTAQLTPQTNHVADIQRNPPTRVFFNNLLTQLPPAPLLQGTVIAQTANSALLVDSHGLLILIHNRGRTFDSGVSSISFQVNNECSIDAMASAVPTVTTPPGHPFRKCALPQTNPAQFFTSISEMVAASRETQTFFNIMCNVDPTSTPAVAYDSLSSVALSCFSQLDQNTGYYLINVTSRKSSTASPRKGGAPTTGFARTFVVFDRNRHSAAFTVSPLTVEFIPDRIDIPQMSIFSHDAFIASSPNTFFKILHASVLSIEDLKTTGSWGYIQKVSFKVGLSPHSEKLIIFQTEKFLPKNAKAFTATLLKVGEFRGELNLTAGADSTISVLTLATSATLADNSVADPSSRRRGREDEIAEEEEIL